jgi:hypothetical protein
MGGTDPGSLPVDPTRPSSSGAQAAVATAQAPPAR